MDISSILDNKLIIALGSGMVGALAARILSLMKGRVQELQYTVKHESVAISADDAIFGSVKASWQGNELKNLYNTKLVLFNDTARDFKDVVVKIYSGDTVLLSERCVIDGTTYIPEYTEEYKKKVPIPPTEPFSEEQLKIYRHGREYKIIALNREQSATFTYLTTVPVGNGGPGVWADIQQEGVRAVHKEIVPEVHGVPLKRALPVGLVACFVILGLVSGLNFPIWLAAGITLLVGLMAQSLGAWLCKVAAAIKRFFSH
ncbi:hypothetical protein IGS61_12715 [Janthinobacterium sp. FW305-129]|uniref:hypothetical protein n=1 Tax=Janthinobacterium sp. FW305-129 TaxID=2775054 RepID=UPI001E399B48|nr:hypothetical protein [Janthinobacterium sp. FW305-129]MCC7598355.1 hypothetical protein [Janthinobacterium sp. FW305-129]